MTKTQPENVLFPCTGNSTRGIPSEAILNRIGGSDFREFSAGSRPVGKVNPCTAHSDFVDPAVVTGKSTEKRETFARTCRTLEGRIQSLVNQSSRNSQ